MSFHPGGDHLIVATQHPVVRLYDVNTLQCFVCSIASHQHTSTVTCLKWSQDARVFATCSKDGSIKLWDGVSNRCVNTFPKAHDGLEVCSVAFTKTESIYCLQGRILYANCGSWQQAGVWLLIQVQGLQESKNLKHRLCSIIQKTMCCFLMKPRHHCAHGIHVMHPGNSWCRWDTMELFDWLLIHRLRLLSLLVPMILELDFGIEEHLHCNCIV